MARSPGLCLLVVVLCVHGARAQGSFGVCEDTLGDSSESAVVIDNIEIFPKQPRTNQTLRVRVSGHLPDRIDDSTLTVSAAVYLVNATIWYCRRAQDCMAVFGVKKHLSEFLNSSCEDCLQLRSGREFVSETSWQLPLEMVRGSYNLNVELFGPSGASSCYQLHGVTVLASRWFNKLRDMRDALVAFAVAASSSKLLGASFPTLSWGLLPQITGFLLIGIVVGPYCSNLVTRMHIAIIGNFINCVSLAFIAGAAGAEIFLPELQSLLAPMTLQVLFISLATLFFCVSGVLLVTSCGLVDVPSISGQPSFSVRLALALLAATMMTARSPASVIAVISELECGETIAAKMSIGITVLSDIVVLILFSVAKQLAGVATEGAQLGMGVFAEVAGELLASIVVGCVVGEALKLVLPKEPPLESDVGDASPSRRGGTGPSRRRSPIKASQSTSTVDNENAFDHELGQLTQALNALGDLETTDPVRVTIEGRIKDIRVKLRLTRELLPPRDLSAESDAMNRLLDGGTDDKLASFFTRNLALLGLVVIVVLSLMFFLASWLKSATGGKVHLEPLLTCTIASCWCGHDRERRPQLLEALSLWTPVVLLPFFTLAGASLELPLVLEVLPGALTLVVLRMLGIASGSMTAGRLTQKLLPAASTPDTSVRCMWLTVLAQAGVTLGLVLEVKREFPAWSRPFATLIIGVVVINQMQGPVLCRLGLQCMVAAEEFREGYGVSPDTELSSSLADSDSSTES